MQYLDAISKTTECSLFVFKANWKWSNEMAKVNVDIQGISELKWTGMSEFNSDDH